jgi:hypothetical protein
VLGFEVAIGRIQLVGQDSTLAFILALILLLPGIALMPIDYGAGLVFVTRTVAMIYSCTGEVTDFLKFRVLDDLVGVAVVGAGCCSRGPRSCASPLCRFGEAPAAHP